MQVQLDQIAKAQGLIERGPVTFLAAVEFIAIALLAALWVRAVLRSERRERAHSREIEKRDAAHDARVDELIRAHHEQLVEMQRDQLEQGIKLEHIVQGMLRLVTFGGEVRPMKRRAVRKPTTSPRQALPEPEQEAPTQVLEEEPDDD